MPNDDHPTDDAASPPDPNVGVRLEAATTLILNDEESGVPGAEAEGTTTASPSPAPSPPLRIILALRPCPREGDTAPIYDVTISADRGKDAEFDPYWRSFAGLDLHSALDEASGVVADAEEHWLASPRYPRVTPQPANGGKGKTAPPAKRTPAAPTVVLPPATSTSPTAPSDAATDSIDPIPASIPASRAAGVPGERANSTEVGEVVLPAASGPLLPPVKPQADAGKPGDSKQLSLFG